MGMVWNRVAVPQEPSSCGRGKAAFAHFQRPPRAHYIILNRARGGVQLCSVAGFSRILLGLGRRPASASPFLVSCGTIWAPGGGVVGGFAHQWCELLGKLPAWVSIAVSYGTIMGSNGAGVFDFWVTWGGKGGKMANLGCPWFKLINSRYPAG